MNKEDRRLGEKSIWTGQNKDEDTNKGNKTLPWNFNIVSLGVIRRMVVDKIDSMYSLGWLLI